MGPKVPTLFFGNLFFCSGLRKKTAVFTRFAFHLGTSFLTTNLILLDFSSMHTCYY